MPNHVESYLRVSGPKEDVMALRDLLKSDGQVMDANKLIPYPFREQDDRYNEAFPHYEIYKEETATLLQKAYVAKYGLKDGNVHDGYNMGGYEWCCENWGTKWGFYDDKIAEEHYGETGGHILYTFNTAWSPAYPLMSKMSELFPELKFIYVAIDEGGLFADRYEFETPNVDFWHSEEYADKYSMYDEDDNPIDNSRHEIFRDLRGDDEDD
jgi:hypothetical protein